MFGDWDNFYLLVGSAAGALIGLMFVVVTLTAGLRSNRSVKRAARVYITPIVFHFAIVVVVSALTAVPGIPRSVDGVILAACAATGIIYTSVTTIRLFTPGWDVPPDLEDKCLYGLLPSLAYLALAGAAAAVWLAPLSAPYAVGGTMLALLLIGIRNAWDLATYIVHRTLDRVTETEKKEPAAKRSDA